ncbi:hypothetical protein EXIGLDRAFT_830659 [Exidia glandulosa HHB12029]|uniref:RRM domain-containing protein n=1 Tax=Exidia glandulosa HHB12029 TaxID=1314781 RepID=A0A166BF44_EXIGL|nr:hypothetical protein EXIGLDRAFT_830659 [Exidia glandulosa HHB12029]
MSRHHPYGGYDGPQRRGGPPGPGPERHARFERGGSRGGRGGRGGAPGRGGYGGGPPPSNGYGNNQYNAAAPYGGGGESYNDYSGASEGRYQDSYEDDPGREPMQHRRRERDDHVHESLIEERIQRERPCRTLFIRNIKYETNSEDVRHQFEEYGEIKSFYDLVSSRGMVFVTYFDLRAAERARERLQGTEIAGRPIDVHYSLPRADEQSGRCDRDKNQGTLLVALHNSASGQPLDDNELRRKFQQFGDVKGIKPAGGINERYVELYDTRACEAAHDKLRHQPLQDGEMDIAFAWDIPDHPLPPGPVPRKNENDSPRGGFSGDRGRGRGRGRGFARGQGFRGGYGGGGGGGGGDYRDDNDGRYGGRDDWDQRSHDRRDPHDGYTRDRPPPRTYDGYNPPDIGPAANMYGYGNPDGPPPENRLEQAKKVQQLLEALKHPPGAAAAPSPPASAASRPGPPAPGLPGVSGPPGSYYAPPSVPAAVPPPSTAYSQAPYAQPQYPPYNAPPPPGPSAAPHAAAPPPATAAPIPANLLALLQAQQTPTPPPPFNHSGPPPPAVNHAAMYQQQPPPSAPAPALVASGSTPTAAAGQMQSAQVAQLMAMLQQKRA